ncbi:hypothetical protein M9Y10_024076 [Tritrichomonas musculus]|uniref:Cullin family profile domain-containing protein n=1 Tax=Tritrichomonas musculus TaxID=1915356 RepID=A0ABR2KXZ8_9EUKA
MPRQRIKSQNKIDNPWETLSNAIKVTLENKQFDLRLSIIHKACTELVNKGAYDLIFNGLSDLLKAHFQEWHQQLSTVAGDPLLTRLSDQYEDFKNYCSIFPKFYMSYDHHFKNEKQPDKVLNHIRRLFIQIILSDTNLFKKAATPSIIKVIYNAQKGLDVDLSKISNLLEMYYSFRGKSDVPEIFEDFTDSFLAKENDFYAKFFENNFNGHSFPDYLDLTAEQYNRDKRIFEEIFEPAEVNEYLSNLHVSLLSSKQDEFLNGAEPPISQALTASDLRPMKWLVETYEHFGADLKPIYSNCALYIMNEMLKRTQDFPEVKKEEKGDKKKAPKTEEKDGMAKPAKVDIYTLVGQLIDLTIKLSDPYLKVFTTKDTTKQLEDSIRLAWNDERFNINENFNEYIDSLVKEEFKGSSIDDQCVIIARFYRYLSDKAKFKNLYESSFVRRLIKMRSKVATYDYPIINAIKKITNDFMTNLDAFKKQFTDSEQLKDDFKKATAEDAQKNYVSIEPFIFDQGTFPLPREEEINVPAKAIETNTSFLNFYNEKHKQQILILISSCSSVEFSLKVPTKNRVFKTYSITTDLPCGCVLSALAEKPFKFGEIVKLLNNNRTIASKVVLRLSEAKVKLLSRKGASNKLSDEDEFSINPSFQSGKPKIIVPPIVSERRSCREVTMSKDETEKKDSVNAAIVRTLKQKGKIESGVLERTVIEMLHDSFECTAEMVRRGVTSCEGQYLRRDIINGETILTYIA